MCRGATFETAKTSDAQLRAQELSNLTKIIAAWPKLSGGFRAALLAVTQSATVLTATGVTQEIFGNKSVV